MAIAADTSRIVAANIRAELAYRQESATDLAAALDITRSTMYRRLSGDTSWPVDEVEAAAHHFGIPVLSLLTQGRAA